MSGHTPGPWWASNLEVGTAPMMMVKVCNHVSGSNHAEAKANALLIAAAPDLLEVLQKLCEAADDSDGCQYGTLSTSFVRDISISAIAKATTK